MQSFQACIYWPYHEKVFSQNPDIFERVKQDVLLALIKLVLTIYDQEDFNRIFFKEEINTQRMKFLHDLNNSPPKTTTEAILAIGKGEVDFGKFPLLLERDVGNILERREIHYATSEGNLEEYVADASPWLIEDAKVPKPLLEKTISVMKNHSPLKRNCAMHLMMELAHRNCNCVLDTLILEFWRDIDVSRLEEFTSVSSDNISLFLLDILDALFCLVQWRTHELCYSRVEAMFPYLFGAFGACTEDVSDVVEHADCERRWEGENFIGTRHLLLGLLRTTIAESVQKFGFIRDDSKEPSRHHVLYDTYKAAEDVAKVYGVTDIKLGHLFLAIMVVNLKINQNPKWVEALRSTTEGLAVEEYIPIFEERMVDVLEIDLGKFDTKALVGKGLANEEQTWDASLTRKTIEVFREGRKKYLERDQILKKLWSVDQCLSWDSALWDSVQPTAKLCETYELPILRGNGRLEEREGGN
ncbi:hypothetical protein RHMOL_Rhmol02G0020300 [Rhododendron molle]|uniref:Uncharacterized protein n=2 Tax=Rhododendron molle TaxID=49168 RepID=A0ACC0PNU9_RHOML|nr:hypothetical protein RHMOL_Rhmol02G0020300 [Rhododendron molle]KAI8566184.1 hypothetical protein RHMOL_Rhmol02G0020300 [Rhododendron molle]